MISSSHPAQILTVTGSYPTDVGICIVTDAPDKLRLAFDHWGFPAGWVCGTDNELPADEKYALLWEHRGVIANVASEGASRGLHRAAAPAPAAQLMRCTGKKCSEMLAIRFPSSGVPVCVAARQERAALEEFCPMLDRLHNRAVH